jgi:cytochrome b subunit of formate dehydrogenase
MVNESSSTAGYANGNKILIAVLLVGGLIVAITGIVGLASG